MVKQGIPLRVAAASKFIRPKTLQNWLTVGGNFEEAPVHKKTKTNPLVELEDGTHVRQSEWDDHETQCYKLFQEASGYESARVGGLLASMWKSALPGPNKYADPEMQKFLFKQYGHVHGLGVQPAEKSKGANPDPASDGDLDQLVQIHLPDNGRDPL